MLILGIESSCDETAAAVVRDGKQVLSNAVFSQIDKHRPYGGVVPEIASRAHIDAVVPVTRRALADAGVGLEQIDAVAVTYAPGLIGALLVGVNFAKSLAWAAGKPLVPVNHLRGHVAAAYLEHPELKPPFVALVASGGHSTLAAVDDYCEFRVLGRAVDDAAGEAFDKVARVLGLPYPGGPEIARLAKNGDRGAYRLPEPHTEQPYDVSFSGLKTAVINIVHTAEMKGETIDRAGLAASFQYRACDMLSRRIAAAAAGCHAVLCGGVAQNALLRDMTAARCAKAGATLYTPSATYCGDNAAMIAAAGYYEYKRGNTGDAGLNACAMRDIAAE